MCVGSGGWRKENRESLSCVGLFVTPWTVARQTPLSMGFFRQEYWSGLPFPSPRDLPNSGIEPKFPLSLALQVDSLGAKPLGNFPFKNRVGVDNRGWDKASLRTIETFQF